MKLNDAVFDPSNENNVFEKVSTKEKKAILVHVQRGISSKADQWFANNLLSFSKVVILPTHPGVFMSYELLCSCM